MCIFGKTGKDVSMLVAKRKFVCKHCKVEVLSPKDTRPILGKTHKKSCPRRRVQG